MAEEATRSEDRDRYQHEQKLWLQIAEELERRDESILDCGVPARTGM
jgi:hypothetical protein